MRIRWNVCVLVLAVLTAALPLAGAQCIGDDGLYTGQCYQPVKPKLPPFPAMKSTAQWIPWRTCTPYREQRATLVLPPPIQLVCGVYMWSGVDLAVNGTKLWNTNDIWFLFYTRTWMETDVNSPTPARYQVWRFLVNADVRPSPQLMAQYPVHNPANDYIVPPCVYHGKPQPVHYYGYVDYAVNCTTNQWSIAFGVTHLCDIFKHHVFSPHPLGGHPDYSYTVVAPGNFTPNPMLPGIQGPVHTEAFRMYRFANLPLCESEQKIRSGVIMIENRRCTCGAIPNAPAQFIYHNTQATTVCNSWARSISPFPVLWNGSVQMSVGTFNGPGYPGNEELYFLVDPMFYRDGLTNALRGDVFVGVGTQEGWQAMLFEPAPVPVLPRSFVDLQNVLLLPFLYQGIGGAYISDILIYLNTY